MHRKKLAARKKAKNALRILLAARIRNIASTSAIRIKKLKKQRKLKQKLLRKDNIKPLLMIEPPEWAALSFYNCSVEG